MATLTDDELARIKYEVLDNVLALGAEPYITIYAVYDIIRDNVVSSSVAPTTSSTAVTAVGSVTLTLASVTGFAVGQKVQLDTDEARETVTIRAIAGSTINVLCRKLHAGTYPVEVESALTLVRGLLSDLARLDETERDAYSGLGIKSVDEVQFFGAGEGGTTVEQIAKARTSRRESLARACGISYILNAGRAMKRGGGGFEAY